MSEADKKREYNKQYREANKEKIKEYREANKEKIKEYREANQEKLKEYSKEYNKQYYAANQEKLKEYREANKEKLKEYREANQEKIKEYNEANKENNNERARRRKKTDSLFKMRCVLTSRTCSAFKSKGYKKSSKTQEMLGVDFEVCKAHIERQFKKGMNWSNHGEWHIDHIIPLASAKNEKNLRKLCHYRNLQPLWAVDNLSKSDKIIGQQSFMRI